MIWWSDCCDEKGNAKRKTEWPAFSCLILSNKVEWSGSMPWLFVALLLFFHSYILKSRGVVESCWQWLDDIGFILVNYYVNLVTFFLPPIAKLGLSLTHLFLAVGATLSRDQDKLSFLYFFLSSYCNGRNTRLSRHIIIKFFSRLALWCQLCSVDGWIDEWDRTTVLSWCICIYLLSYFLSFLLFLSFCCRPSSSPPPSQF